MCRTRRSRTRRRPRRPVGGDPEGHPTAHVTVTDIEPESVTAMTAGELGSHPRALVREMDATAIDAPDGRYALAVFALSFHHLPPPTAAAVLAEAPASRTSC